jgi:D-amino peptidase
MIKLLNRNINYIYALNLIVLLNLILMKRLSVLLALLVLTVGSVLCQKILISVDMEGLAGVVTSAQLGPSGFEYQRFRQFMTDETLAAIDGAVEAGAKEIVVVDSHGNGQNILIEKLPEDVMVIRSWPRRFGMVAGIDDSFDGVILIGYHASTHNPEGVRAHTFSSARLTRVVVNNIPVSEGMWVAMVAGYFNVPVIMISGDDIATAEVKDFLGDVEVAVVKEAMGFHAAKSFTPAAADKIIKQASFTAVKNLKHYQPYKLEGSPVSLEVTFKHYQPSQILAYLPIVKRIDSHTIQYEGKDMVAVADFFVFLMEYMSGTTEP